MRFTTQREVLLKPLQFVIGVVERRQTMAILSNVLLKAHKNQLTMTATDLEVEIVAHTNIDITTAGEVTIPARKFLDICKALPDNAELEFSVDQEKERVNIRSGRSRFNLTTLPVKDFPNIQNISQQFELQITQAALKRLIDKTQFSMAQQDVRYYLNGLMLEMDHHVVRAVATDGHRLSFCELDCDVEPKQTCQIIVPRKGINELSKLLDGGEAKARLMVGTNHIRVEANDIEFTSKLIDGQFPDYDRVIPKNSDKLIVTNRNELRQALVRTSILSNEKYRGIRVRLGNGVLNAQAHNPEMEEAEEEIEVNYSGEEFEIGFNVNYLLDALAAISTDDVCLKFGDSNSSCLVLPNDEEPDHKYVIMPMRL